MESLGKKQAILLTKVHTFFRSMKNAPNIIAGYGKELIKVIAHNLVHVEMLINT